MSVMLETSLGELVIDLETERCPRTCENFLKLCKMKYYALNAFFNGESDLVLQGSASTSGWRYDGCGVVLLTPSRINRHLGTNGGTKSSGIFMRRAGET